MEASYHDRRLCAERRECLHVLYQGEVIIKLVPYPPGFRPAQTFYCTQCDRFGLSSNGQIPICPVHGATMVASETDPRRVESNAPIEDQNRRPPVKRAYTSEEDIRELLAKTDALNRAIGSLMSNSFAIPIIYNAQDEDVAMEAHFGLLAHGRNSRVSLPSPRYQAAGRLDPNWLQKYRPLLEGCQVAVYARRAGTTPNLATQAELNILEESRKPILLYEW